MPKAVEPEIYEVAEGFVCPAGSFRKGQLFRSDDPLVKQYPAQFRAAVIVSTRKPEPIIEQATAAPGEKR
jgi:hypothetical protein